jgi:hypothetical protein
MTETFDDPHGMMEMVAEFQTAFDTSKDPDLWLKLILEEKAEVLEALEHLLKEISDLGYVSIGYINATGGMPPLDNRPDSADIVAAFQWSTVIAQVLGGPVMQEAFRRVHASNMSKLGADGKPIRREDGKVLKGPNYAPPVLSDLVRG